jgi:hypothetical protein
MCRRMYAHAARVCARAVVCQANVPFVTCSNNGASGVLHHGSTGELVHFRDQGFAAISSDLPLGVRQNSRSVGDNLVLVLLRIFA